jgi:non-specific serine/threonine protein kinase
MAEDLVPLALAIAPSGTVHLDARPSAESVALVSLARELTSDLARGPGFAILQLAARHPGETLPPSVAFFREVGAVFLARACGAPEPSRIEAPSDELARLVSQAPPMSGGEYLRVTALEALWSDLAAALRSELRETSLDDWFKERHAAWNVVGRVCFHLAENKADEHRPFAFLATYTTRLSRAARPQHRPLGQALRDFAQDKPALLALLLPVTRASAQSVLVRELSDSGGLFRTLTWTPAEALRFLREVPALEKAGIVVRIPDWWKKRSRLAVEVTVGDKKPSSLGLDALVDFDVSLALDGETLSEKEWRALEAQGEGLALVRGRWVEDERKKLEQLL